MLSKRVESLSESLTIAISMLAQELKNEGKDVLAFSAGEPDFGTPQVIKEEAKKAIDEDFTKYTSVPGIKEVLTAIKEKLKRDNNLDYDESDIIVSNGAKHSLFNLFQSTINSGDEVIIPAPYWVTYPELVKYSEGVVVPIKTTEKTHFKITPEELKRAITPKTKMVVLTTPSNPTGACYTKEELKEIGEVLKGTDILVASDEMYEKLIYDNKKFTSTASVSEDMFKRTITINGLSKSVAMTGWRFGYLATPIKELSKAMKRLQSQATSNVNSITQKAAIAGLDGRADRDIENMREIFEKRRDIACNLLNEIEGLSVLKPDGAFYLFVNTKEIEIDSLKFSKELLSKKGVAVVPGIGFGMDGYFRFSFAYSEDDLREGIKRIGEFVKEYKK